jgi:hypothetical protein
MFILLIFCISLLALVVGSGWFLLTGGTPDPLYNLLLLHREFYITTGSTAVISAFWYMWENW